MDWKPAFATLIMAPWWCAVKQQDRVGRDSIILRSLAMEWYCSPWCVVQIRFLGFLK